MWIWQIVWLLNFGLLIAPLVIWLVWDALCFTLWRTGSNASSTTRPSKAARPLRPRTSDDCPVCRHKPSDAATEQAANATEPVALTPYAQVKSPRGRKKQLPTTGFACPSPHCLYFGVTDDSIHAVVHCGSHGRHERIADLKCQACGRKFSVRFGTALYHLKTPSSRVAMVLTALAEGVGVAAAARIFSHSEFTIQTWLTRAGLHAQSLHQRLLHGLHLTHVQLDEVRTAIRHGSQIVWVWIAIDARSKLVAAMHIGPRTQDLAHALIHTLKDTLAPDCIPLFTSDGLMLYFYALTSHCGHWIHDAYSRARRWQVSPQLLYGQVKKLYRRRRVQRVDHRAILGGIEQIKAALLPLGFSGTIQTALVERFNATLRHGVSTLVRPHGGLRQAMQTSLPLRSRVPYYRQRTPAMAAGITTGRWSVLAVLSFPIPPGPRPDCVSCL